MGPRAEVARILMASPPTARPSLMAIGLPVVCTDCPAGGARAVIKDHENGLLVPVKDPHRLYLAMKEIIDNPELAEKLSDNASKIRQVQSEETIMKEWELLLNREES